MHLICNLISLMQVYKETLDPFLLGCDPIHDQLMYLDADLSENLYNGYGSGSKSVQLHLNCGGLCFTRSEFSSGTITR